MDFNDSFSGFLQSFAKSGVISNNASSVGTSRDSSSYNQVNEALKLSYQECYSLYRNSKIIENIICKVPDASISSLLGWDLSGNATKEDNFSKEYFQWLESIGFFESLTDALYLSRLLGDGFVLLDIEDGQDYKETLDLKNIKNINFSIAKGQDECQTLDSWLQPQQYRVTRSGFNEKEKKLDLIYHRSRLIHLTGKRLFGTMLRQNGGKHDSILNQMFQSYANWETANADVKTMLSTHSLFAFSVRGLAKLMDTKNCDGRASLWSRFESMMMSLNVMKGIPYDAETENIDFINRNFSGVQESHDILSKAVLSATDLPSYIVFGITNGTAFSESGLSERLAFDQIVQTFSKTVVTKALKTITEIAKNLPSSPAYKLNYITPVFGSTLTLSDIENAKLTYTLAQADKLYIDAKVLTPETVKLSRFNQSGKIGLYIQDV